MYLYKYRNLVGNNRGRLKRIICESSIWFASPADFNDPFDCAVEQTFEGTVEDKRRYWGSAMVFQLAKQKYFCLEPEFMDRAMRREIDPYEEILARAKRGAIPVTPDFLERNLSENMARDGSEVERRKIGDSFQASVNALGVLSLSAIRDHILLWSHYADSHRGLCLEFKFEPGSTPFGSPLFSSASQVKYQVAHPDVSLYEKDERTWREEVLLTKAKPWEYEQEYRCIDPDGPGEKGFPESQLTGIIFGCAMPDSDRSEVKDWSDSRAMTLARYEARRVSRTFTLKVEQIE